MPTDPPRAGTARGTARPCTRIRAAALSLEETMSSTDQRPAVSARCNRWSPLARINHRVDRDAPSRSPPTSWARPPRLVVVSAHGEAPTLTDVEKIDLARAVVEAVGARRPWSPASAPTHPLRRPRPRAPEVGVCVVVTPYYSRPPPGRRRPHTPRSRTPPTPVMLMTPRPRRDSAGAGDRCAWRRTPHRRAPGVSRLPRHGAEPRLLPGETR